LTNFHRKFHYDHSIIVFCENNMKFRHLLVIFLPLVTHQLPQLCDVIDNKIIFKFLINFLSTNVRSWMRRTTVEFPIWMTARISLFALKINKFTRDVQSIAIFFHFALRNVWHWEINASQLDVSKVLGQKLIEKNKIIILTYFFEFQIFSSIFEL
jgi:hypothetical protein